MLTSAHSARPVSTDKKRHPGELIYKPECIHLRMDLSIVSTAQCDPPFFHQRGWDTHLPGVQFAYNTSKHATTGFSPFFLLHGREARHRSNKISQQKELTHQLREEQLIDILEAKVKLGGYFIPDYNRQAMLEAMEAIPSDLRERHNARLINMLIVRANAARENTPIIILAGYQDHIEKEVFALNPGFRSRFHHIVTFAPMEVEQLAEILLLKIQQSYVRCEGCGLPELKEAIMHLPREYFAHSNARVAGQITQNIKVESPAFTPGFRPSLRTGLAIPTGNIDQIENIRTLIERVDLELEESWASVFKFGEEQQASSHFADLWNKLVSTLVRLYKERADSLIQHKKILQSGKTVCVTAAASRFVGKLGHSDGLHGGTTERLSTRAFNLSSTASLVTTG
ncbi:hypothetical protein Bbelb_350170 [Branchiostoma belcheri]|nr:hypothetical protein Bbelb_350170 [Branchiostoma belcheri]